MTAAAASSVRHAPEHPKPAQQRSKAARPRPRRIIIGHRERLRERFLDAGPDAVTEYELLELVLFRAIPRRDVKPLAKALIAKFGSFAEVVAAPSAAAARRSRAWARPRIDRAQDRAGGGQPARARRR